MVNVHRIVSNKKNHGSLLYSLQFRIHPLAFACAAAMTFGLTTLPAQAAEGLSGNAGTDASATAGAVGSNGQTDGNPGNPGVRGGDGGNAATGGQGGSGGTASISATNTIASGDSLIGGAGGAGGHANGGNGGNGGSAASGSNANGGNGGDAGQAGIAGSGGAGGSAISGTEFSVNNSGSLVGGAGGNGGNALGGAGGQGGQGANNTGNSGNGGNGSNGGIAGNGGVGGAAVTGDNFQLVNQGAITGGQGGVAGSADGGAAGSSNLAGSSGNTGSVGLQGVNGTPGTYGAGGVGVVSSGSSSVTTSGVISGGLAGDGTTRANAIELSGGNNVLTLQSGYSFVGNVISSGGDTLSLGGDTGGSFSVGSIASTSPTSWTGNEQYYGFSNYVKTGSGTWILTGTTTVFTPWTINSGTLSVSSDGNLGAAGSQLTLSGGTLQNTSEFSTARDILLSGSGSFQTLENLTVTGLISGSGQLIKTGSSALILTNNNTYTGGTTLSAGTLQLGNGGTTGSVTGNILNNGSLVFNRSDALTYADVISGTGQLVQTGNGTLTLTGQNSYTGGTTINSGTLQIGNGGITGAITGDILNNGSLVFNRSDSLTYGGAVSGSGNFVKAGNGTLTLLGDNTYTGGTTLNSGTLQIGNGGTAGAISGNILNNASLVFNRSDSLTYGSVISGTGHFTQSGDGVLTLLGDNTYTGGTTINSGTLQLGNGGATGSVTGNILNNGSLVFNRGDALTYGNVISGSGSLANTGNGTLTLTGQNTYTGSTSITAGTLKTSANNVVANSSDVTIAKGATLNLDGTNQVLQNLTNMGSILLADISAAVNPAARVALVPASVTVTGDITNSGTLFINNGNGTVGNRYTQNGNWFGDTGSTVHMAFVAERDNSLTDKLIITGNATGSTVVSVSNLGGQGAKTVNGIELIDVWGTSSDNAFTQSGRIVAGAYDYSLVKGDAFGQDSQSWYLTSKLTNEDNYRPEAGAYTANLIAANTMFNLSLDDRAGETSYIDATTGTLKATSLWMRNVGGHQRFAMNDGQNKTQANRYVLQIGSDISEWSKTGNDSYRLGVMAGYAKQQGNTVNNSSGNNAKSQIDGYSTGVYGTFFQDDKNKNGLYADTWLQYNWFNNTVSGNDLESESYKSSGVTASLEGGYAFTVGSYHSGDGMINSLQLQPKAQVIWMGVKAKSHTESNGTVVQSNGNDNIQTRLGLKATLSGQSHLDKGTERQFKPFVEGNWVNNSQQYGVRMDDVASSAQGTRNIAELKAGVEGNISKNIDLWVGVTQQVGDKSYSDTQGSLGGRYNF